jgi:hypothetical protein
MSKSNKAEDIMKLLKRGYSIKNIKKLAKTSESYIYMIKKRLEEATGEVLTTADEVLTEAAAAVKEACTFTPKPEPEVKAKEEELDTVLDRREEQYGSYMQSADTAIKIKGAMHNAIARNDLHLFPDQLMSLDMIAVKISRIVNGNPSHRDSWLDIAGYAMLVADRLQGKSR